MAVTSATSSISYTGNASTVTSYAVPFVFLENSHLSAIAKVTSTGAESVVTLTNHVGAGSIDGGTVCTAVSVPATSTLTISRTVPATQTTQYAEGGDFPAASHERALDKLTMLGQQIARSISRTVRLSDAAPETDPLPVLPNRFFGTDETGAIALVTGTDSPAGSLTDANIASNADIALSKLATGALPAAITVASANLVDGTIVNADISDTAAIAASKLASTLDLSGKTVTLPDDSVSAGKIANGAVIPTKLSQPFTRATEAATDGGLSIDFIDIPSWVRRISVVLNQVSTDGTSGLIIQLGHGSGAYTTTGYIGTGTAITGNNLCSISSFTAGFSAGTGALITSARSGCLFLFNIHGNAWVASGALTNGSLAAGTTAGVVALGGTLNKLRISTIGGNDSFDAGSINIMYEG
jgi:hypothetical protein